MMLKKNTCLSKLPLVSKVAFDEGILKSVPVNVCGTLPRMGFRYEAREAFEDSVILWEERGNRHFRA